MAAFEDAYSGGTGHFNQLTASELERLSILAEECAEVIQIVNKIIRHGYESCNPFDTEKTTNRRLLEKELGDMSYAEGALIQHDDVDAIRINNRRMQKEQDIRKYLHHQ